MENSGLQLQPHEISFCSTYGPCSRVSQEIHGIFIKLQFIVPVATRICISICCEATALFLMFLYFVLYIYFYLSINLFSVELHASTNL